MGVSKPYGDGDMRFEYVEVRPGDAGSWAADLDRNYCAWLLEGPGLSIQTPRPETCCSTLTSMEVLVVPKGQDWGLHLGSEAEGSALVFLISANITESSYSCEVLKHLAKAVQKPCADVAVLGG